jgi:hypothetical protein
MKINVLCFFDTWLVHELSYDRLEMNVVYFFDAWLTHEQCETAVSSMD